MPFAEESFFFVSSFFSRSARVTLISSRFAFEGRDLCIEILAPSNHNKFVTQHNYKPLLILSLTYIHT